jgi:8-oxo-dGTP pyrophosphatase MutT (NUDIX family)
MGRSGDGFVTLPDGTRRWGRYGAAGILARHVGADEQPRYFVALRSPLCHHGGTWSIPGGALDHGESPLDGALREFQEEIALDLGDAQVAGVHEDDHGGWAYWTIVVDVTEPFDLPSTYGWETTECRWVGADELADLALYGAFRTTLTRLGVLAA